MAYYDDQDEEQLNPEGQQGQQISGQVGTISGQGATPGAGTTQAPDNPGNFVGIKQYLDANKPQATKLGDQAAGVVTSAADAARNDVNSLNSFADSQIKGVQSLDSGVVDRIKNNAESLSQQERDAAKNTASAQYKGPANETELGDVYSNALKSTSKAKQNLDNTGTEQGRMDLVTQINQAPRTQGINIFDNALLQAGGGREKLASVAQQNQDIPSLLDNSATEIRNKIGRADDPSTPEDESAGAIGQTNKAQSDAYSTIQSALNNWKSAFTPKVEQARKSIVDTQNRISPELGGYELSQETLGLLGLQAGDRTYGANLNEYLTPSSPTDINAANIASAEDYARYAALADLSGDSSGILSPENAALAGTANLQAYGQKKDAKGNDLKTAIQQAKDAYLNQAKNTASVANYGFKDAQLGGQTYNQILNDTIPQLVNTIIPELSYQVHNRGLGGNGLAAANDLLARARAIIARLDAPDSPMGSFSTIKQK